MSKQHDIYPVWLLWPLILPDAHLKRLWGPDSKTEEVYTIIVPKVPKDGIFIAENPEVVRPLISTKFLAHERLTRDRTDLRWVDAYDTAQARVILEQQGIITWDREPLTTDERNFLAALHYAKRREEGVEPALTREYLEQAFCATGSARSMTRLVRSATNLSEQAAATYGRMAQRKKGSPTKLEAFVATYPDPNDQDARIEAMRIARDDSSVAFDVDEDTGLSVAGVSSRIRQILADHEQSNNLYGLLGALNQLLNEVVVLADEASSQRGDNDQ